MSKPNNQQQTTIFKANLSKFQRGYTYLYSIKVFCVCSTNSYSSSNILRQRTAFLKGNLRKSVNLRLNVSDSDELTQFKIKCISNNLRQFKTIIQRTRLINLENRSINMVRENKERKNSDMLMDRFNDIDYSEERRLKKGIFSEEFDEMFKRNKFQIIQDKKGDNKQ